MGFASSQANIHVEKGKTYALELRRGLVDFAALGSPFACWGRVRIGGKKAVKDEDALAEAVRLAKESDGVYFICYCEHKTVTHIVWLSCDRGCRA